MCCCAEIVVLPMIEKPHSLDDYKHWLWAEHRLDLYGQCAAYYRLSSEDLQKQLQSGVFWRKLKELLIESDDDYRSKTNYPLLVVKSAPEVSIKPYESVLDKSYRKNILRNLEWPRPPGGQWVLHPQWLWLLGDVLRTTIVVKYMDGIRFLGERILRLAKSEGIECNFELQATPWGYYAGHLQLSWYAEVAGEGWSPEGRYVGCEIQITTQLQDIIGKLTHTEYEKRRLEAPLAPADRDWQWDHRSSEFATNYLGHILHYLEGMILEVRDRQEGKE